MLAVAREMCAHSLFWRSLWVSKHPLHGSCAESDSLERYERKPVDLGLTDGETLFIGVGVLLAGTNRLLICQRKLVAGSIPATSAEMQRRQLKLHLGLESGGSRILLEVHQAKCPY